MGTLWYKNLIWLYARLGNNVYIKINSLRVHYKVFGTGPALVLLHGWGCDVTHYAKLQEHFAKHFTTYALDLPGFGLSAIPETVWGSADYAKLVAQFIATLEIVDPILVGHSLGGKIIINILAQQLVVAKKVVLISSAGVRLPKPFPVLMKIYWYKLLKKIASLPGLHQLFGAKLELYKKRFGSNDYRSAQGIMRTIIVKIINEDLTAQLAQIKRPTLLLWGDKDCSAPLAAAKIMQQQIPDVELKICSGSGHFPFLDNYVEVIAALDKFLL